MTADSRSRRTIMYYIVGRRYKRFAELGVAVGGTMKAIIKYTPAIKMLEEYYAIDKWKDYHKWEMNNKKWEEIYENIKIISKDYKQIRLLRKTTIEAAQLFPDGYFDIVFVDAAHDYASVREDIIAWLPKVRHGGVLMGHDYGYSGLTKAVHEIFENVHFGFSGKTWIYEVLFPFYCKIKDVDLRNRMQLNFVE